MNLMTMVMIIYDFILSLFFPDRCAGCGKYGQLLCFDCAEKIEYIYTSTCLSCGKITLFGQYCKSCRFNHNLGNVLVAASFDQGPVREMLHGFKYNQLIDLGELLGQMQVFRLENSGILQKYKKIVVVPVPLHHKKERIRGYNQSEILARVVSKKIGLKGGCALRRVRETETQVGLSKSERAKNVENAFICTDKELVLDREVILIDDVITTGATMEECAKVLKNAGAKRVIGLVVAKRM